MSVLRTTVRAVSSKPFSWPPKPRNAASAGSDAIARTLILLTRCSPGEKSFDVRDPLVVDECTWFNHAVDRGLLNMADCPPDCFRLKKRGASGPDHFTTPDGKPRHLFSSPEAARPALNREYIPHVAAWARAVYDFGYDPGRCRFSYYRAYSRDLLTKQRGGSYETDVEFDDAAGELYLQIEAKKDARQVAKIATQLDAAPSLAALPAGTVKEIEYVLDLHPRYLWVVGPGSVDPAPHVFAVTVEGNDAAFRRLDAFPPPS